MANLEKKGVDFIKSHRSTIVLLALLFMPASNLWSRTLFAFATAILGTWVFVWFIQRIRFKDLVMVPLVDIVLFSAIFVLVCDMIGRVVIYPYELPIELIVGILGSLIFIALLFHRLKHGRKAIRFGGTGTGCGAVLTDLKGGAEV